MKVTIKSLLLLFVVIASQSCETKQPQLLNTSNNASILNVVMIDTLEKPSIIPANFTIDNENNTITNLDSLAYGTKLDSVFLQIRFYSTLGYIVNDTTPEDYTRSYTQNAYNLTKPITIENLASDAKTKKKYTLKVNVHKVKTYQHTWTKLSDKIGDNVAKNQKAFILNDKFYFISQNGSSAELYTSQEGEKWEKKASPNLPANVNLSKILVHENVAYVINQNNLYKSTDAINWTKTPMNIDSDYDYKALVVYFKKQFWAIAQHKTNKRVKIANSKDGVNWVFVGKRTFGVDFPISDFTAITFKPNLGREKVLIVGGKNSENITLNTRWAAENILGSDSLNWANLSNTQSKFKQISNVGLAYYGSKLLLVGGRKNSGKLVQEEFQLLNSIDQGLTWTVPDENENKLPKEFKMRSNVSAIVYKNSLYLIGGQDENKTLSDVWKVRVNFYDFKDPDKY